MSAGRAAGCFFDFEELKIELSCAANGSCAWTQIPEPGIAAKARPMAIPFESGSLCLGPKLRPKLDERIITALHCRRFRAWMGVAYRTCAKVEKMTQVRASHRLTWLGYGACAMAGCLWGTGFYFGKLALREMSVGHMVL